MTDLHEIIYKLDRTLYNIEWEEILLQHEERMQSVYTMFNKDYPTREASKIKVRISTYKKDYKRLIEQL